MDMAFRSQEIMSIDSVKSNAGDKGIDQYRLPGGTVRTRIDI